MIGPSHLQASFALYHNMSTFLKAGQEKSKRRSQNLDIGAKIGYRREN